MTRPYVPEDLNAVTSAAWESVGPAFLSSVPFAMAGAWLLVEAMDPTDGLSIWWPLAAFAASVLVAAPFWWRWHMALRECARFTADMRRIGRT